ncbi:carbohydrate kinase family protein [Candidatus Woesearchaeota archaeon]|nr:carbohydrate kinase family protein [Candidatus Woesearchaeota archaeon]
MALKTQKKYDFLGIGSSVVDIHAIMKAPERIDIKSPKSLEQYVCVAFASKTPLNDLRLSGGGSAMNSLITMAKLGAKTALISAIGNDTFGKIIREEIDKSCISREFLKVKKGKTGIGINIISEGEKSVLIYRGVLNDLSPKDLPEQAIKRANQVFITALASEQAYQLFLKALKLAKKNRVNIVFAPSISMLRIFSGRLRKLKNDFDLVMLNYEEGCYYTGKKDIKKVLRALPGKVCVVTKDKEGAYARDGRKYYHIGAVPVPVRGTIGAGDAFNGTFAYEYYNTGSVKKAMKLANAVAAMKIEHVDTVFHPSMADVRKFMARYKKYLAVKEVK